MVGSEKRKQDFASKEAVKRLNKSGENRNAVLVSQMKARSSRLSPKFEELDQVDHVT
jgi:hypothetical protein